MFSVKMHYEYVLDKEASEECGGVVLQKIRSQKSSFCKFIAKGNGVFRVKVIVR